jgi:hypothetical protein
VASTVAISSKKSSSSSMAHFAVVLDLTNFDRSDEAE